MADLPNILGLCKASRLLPGQVVYHADPVDPGLVAKEIERVTPYEAHVGQYVLIYTDGTSRIIPGEQQVICA